MLKKEVSLFGLKGAVVEVTRGDLRVVITCGGVSVIVEGKDDFSCNIRPPRDASKLTGKEAGHLADRAIREWKRFQKR